MKKLKLTELNRLSVDEFAVTEKPQLTIILDNVRSGFNVGSVFRSMDCFGFSQVLLCGITPVPPHKEIFKTAIGAQFTMDWSYHKNIVEVCHSLKNDGFKLIGIEQTTQSKFLKELNLDKNQKYAVILGNEVDGLSNEVLPLLDQAIEIEQFGTKHSLNVSVCSGVVFYQLSQLLR